MKLIVTLKGQDSKTGKNRTKEFSDVRWGTDKLNNGAYYRTGELWISRATDKTGQNFTNIAVFPEGEWLFAEVAED